MIDQIDWDRHGGIVGRGVLLDYCSWAQDKSISYDPMSQHAIRLPELLAMAKEYGIEFQRGDILLVRTGWVKWYEEHDTDSRVRCVTRGKAWVGVEGSLEVLEWLWNQHFAAVAGDSIGWEVWPPEGEYSESTTAQPLLSLSLPRPQIASLTVLRAA